ncbi:MAG TPA: hypothetical protein VNT99_17920 [Methylomirabilota bacterium]|nr:hypothetical protein [Methylomirabilota bacterium]
MSRTSIEHTEGNGDPTIAPPPLQIQLEGELEHVLKRCPPFLTLPKALTRCPFSNLSRTGLVELIAPGPRNNFKPPVKAIYKKAHKHAQRGQWLIPAETLFRYLLGLTEDSTATFMATAKIRSDSQKTKANP